MRSLVYILLVGAAVALFLVKNEVNSTAVSKPASASAKIIGGVEAQKGEFPWLVLIELVDTGFVKHKSNNQDVPKAPSAFNGICVGTIIGSNHVLTAAHCVIDTPIKEIRVIAGAHNISRAEPSQQIVAVRQKYIHVDYHEYNGTVRNDIALLIVDSLEYNEFVSPVSLPPNGHEPTGTCWIAGWGQTSNLFNSDVLQKAQIPIVNTTKCATAYPGLLDPDTQVCAGKDEGGIDACMFDTGGPLLCNDLGYMYMAGIVSWGYLCGIPHYPGVYTKVSRYVDWVPAIN